MKGEPGLKRTIGLGSLSLLGLGNILGAGIYVLIGQVAGAAGYAAPISFCLAFAVAALTAFSYIELSGRYPRTAGVSVYLYHAFKNSWLSRSMGLLLIGAGLVSAATLTKGFVGYFQLFADAPGWLIIACLLTALSALAVSGISQSTRLAVYLTIVEVVGLMLVIATGLTHIGGIDRVGHAITGGVGLKGVLVGSFIAFYAFLGFEDMIEVIEEVRDPARIMPKAMLMSLISALVLYILTIIGALLVFTPDQLAGSKAPLADIFSHAIGRSPFILGIIGMAAIVNGILVHIIMGARVLYGLSSQGWISGVFARTHKIYRTPVISTALIGLTIMVLALVFPLLRLAEVTSFFILIVFASVNVSLIVIKRKGGKAAPVHREVPLIIPVLGIASVLGMMVAASLSIG